MRMRCIILSSMACLALQYFFHIISQMARFSGGKKVTERKMFVRTEPHICCCAAIPRREKRSCHHPTTVLSGSRSEWLLAVLYSENGPQGDALCNHGRHRMECDGRTPEDFKRSLPPVLPTMVGSMEQMCVCARVLLWRCKRCRMSYHYSATPHFRELFDCPYYIKIQSRRKQLP